MNALVLNKRKREEAICEFHESGNRELAWILYVHSWGAWGDPFAKEARETAGAVKEILGDLDVEETLRKEYGNGDYWYLLRALAAWGWATGETVDLLPEKYAPLVREALTKKDPGPPGFVIGFLRLYAKRAGAGHLPEDLPQWTMAREALYSERYFLEAAAFDALLDNYDKAREALERHQAQRHNVLDKIASSGKTLWEDGLADSWVKEAQRRTTLEREILLGKPTPERLRDTGLLPF